MKAGFKKAKKGFDSALRPPYTPPTDGAAALSGGFASGFSGLS
jgi:hypothetical protein